MSASLRKSLFWVLRANFVVLLIDLILLLIWLALQNEGLMPPVRKDFLAVLLLLEAALVFLAGGAIVMSASVFANKFREYFFHSKEKWSAEKLRKSESSANLYILTGILLFLESIGLAALL